ncbi:uncharacterized protein LOC132044232 [Lycium ferocissimum]|uniref:uncharacterized protein LOC132044232 n=1 Tax=Lycium ferocissimum TaxID=112874 RepID=UPI0028157D5F|nr:uncharacterized protein LOC132044232 [Lycium ferocissimum]
MSFGLKNADATYQRLVNRMFEHQIGKSMEVYIDDMVVNSLRVDDHLKYLQETFDIVRKCNMKLNPEKCAFGVGSSNFLGFMVSNRGIKINPDKIKAIKDITIVDDIKGVQTLTGRIAALSRFISRSSNKSHRFFLLLKKKTDFAWTPECQRDLEELKRSVQFNNNEAEYETMIAGLELAKSLGAEVIEAKCDSLLVVNYVNGTFDVKEDMMRKYLDKLLVVLHGFKEWTLEHISRDQNNEADALANLGSSVEFEGFNSGAAIQLMSSIIETSHAENLNKRLTGSKHRWKEILPEVLWAYHTAVRSDGEPPFSLVYGAEALIPIDVGESSLRFQHATEASNHEAMTTGLNLADEKRKAVYVRLAAQK